MNRIKTYLALVPIVMLALLPPISTALPIIESTMGPWIVMLAGFAGVCTLFYKINPYVKAIAIFGFINCFYSACPYISHFAYIELIVCIYLYILCTKIDNWTSVFNALWAIAGVYAILIIAQYLGRDNLANFGLSVNVNVLTIGNAMQAKSFLAVLIALLLQDKRVPISFRVWVLIGVLAFWGSVYYFFAHHVWNNFVYARGPVWLESIRMSFQHPFVGYGIGEFKVLFHTIATGHWKLEGNWLNAHNFFVQNLFELGFIGLSIILLYTKRIFNECIKDVRLMAAFILVIYTLCVHFPDRQCQTVPLLLLLLAFIERKHNASNDTSRNHQYCTGTSETETYNCNHRPICPGTGC